MNRSARTVLARRVLAGLAIWMASMPLAAQSIDSLATLALNAHPSIRAARIAIERSDAVARAALAWDAPRVGVDFSMLPTDNINPFARGETMFMAEQEIPLFGQNRTMSDALARQSDVARADLEKARRMLRARVEREYYNLWIIARRAMLATLNRRHAEIIYKSAETRYVAGSAAQSDLLRMSGEIESIAATEKEIAEERSEVLARINTLLARPVDAPIVVADTLPESDLPPFDSLVARLPASPELARMEAMASAARAEADAQETMLKPMLMVRGGLAYMPEGHPVREGNVAEFTGEHAGHEQHAVMRLGLAAGVTFSLPFAPWSRTGPEERAESHRLEAEQALADRDAMRLDMIAMLRSAYARANRALIRIHFYRMTQLPLVEKTIESAIGDYTAGRVSFQSVIDSYHARMLAHEDLAMQQMEYAMALSMISELTGGTR